MFIHYSLWFKRLIHLKETYAHGTRWARKEETLLSKNSFQQPNYSSLLSLSVFYIERNGGRGFNMVKPNSIWGEKKDPNTAILLLQTWLTVIDSANYETSSVFIVGPVLISSVLLLCAFFLYVPHPLHRKSPLQVSIILCESYQFQNTHRVLRRCLEVVDSICLFLWQIMRAGYAIQTSTWIHKHLLLMEKIPKRLTEYGEKVTWCEQFTAVSYNADFQENGCILRNKKHSCLFFLLKTIQVFII